MAICESISKFRLELLPEYWVDEVWNNDFTGQYSLPFDYITEIGKKSCSQLMLDLIDEIKRCLSDKELSIPSTSNSSFVQLSGMSWDVLCMQKVEWKPLLCLLSAFVQGSGGKQVKSGSQYCALNAARLYINLLTIPGAWACKVFNSLLFSQVIGVLQLGIIGDAESSKNPETNEDEDDDDDSMTEDSNNTPGSTKAPLLCEIYAILCDLSMCLKVLKLKEEFNSLQQLLRTLVKLTRLEKEINVLEVQFSIRDNNSKVVVMSYSILKELCVEEHGPVAKTVQCIMSSFLPSLTAVSLNIPMKQRIVIRDHMFSFIKQLLNSLDHNDLISVQALVQQLCVRLPGKADLRAKCVPDVVQLLHILSYSLFHNTIIWIISLTHSDEVHNRVAGIEILSNILEIGFSFNEDDISEELLGQEVLIKLIFSAVLSRLTDVSPQVRQKSLSSLANSFLSKNQTIRTIIADLFVTNNDVEKAVFDFQAHFNASENQRFPDDPLPSGNFLLKCIENLTSDSKVIVRKCAVQVIVNICLLKEDWITEEQLKVFFSVFILNVV